MKKRLEIISDLNKKMINNFENINDLLPLIYDNLSTAEEKQISFSSFEKCMATIYSLLLEYSKKAMDLKEEKFTLEWLKSNISDDNSYILADEVEDDEEPIIVAVYERSSYIQEEYIPTILRLQDLILSEAKFEELFDFYKEDTKNIIGCAKMLMYHTEDLEDLALTAEIELSDGSYVTLDEFKEILEDRRKEK